MFAGRDQTVSKNSPDNYIERDIRWVAVYKPLITKMNAHLTVQWCKKKLRHWSTEMWLHPDELIFIVFLTSE